MKEPMNRLNLTSKENSVNKKFSYTPNETGVVKFNRINETITNRYGDLLNKYIQ